MQRTELRDYRYGGYDAGKEKGEDMMDMGKLLSNQVCHWIDWKILVENDIKIIGNGCTVFKR